MILSFDGKGINGPDQFRSRVATFTNDADAAKYGPLFAAAPELLTACKTVLRYGSGAPSDFAKWHAMSAVQIGEALNDIRAAIARAEGKGA